MAVDILADAINTIKLYDRLGKKQCTVKHSKLIEAILGQLKTNGYVADYTYEDNSKGGILKISLKGKIKEMGIIKPKQPVKKDQWFAVEAHYLPAVNYGRLIVSTPSGIMTNMEARDKNIGGRLIAYVY